MQNFREHSAPPSWCSPPSKTAKPPIKPASSSPEPPKKSPIQPDGAPYRLVALPPPGIQRDPDGCRLPATYANFLIINGAVLVPTYASAHDARALEILAGCFPDRAIVGVDCRSIIRQNGSLHCLTMQFPRALPLHAATTPDEL